jgi:anti-sigma B factor antagonist
MTRSSHSDAQPAPFGLDEGVLEPSGIPVIAVRGELDLFTAPELRNRLRDHTDGTGPVRDLVVDLSACTFVDASGSQVLLRAARRLTAQRRQLAIVNTSGSNARIFSVMGLDELFPVVTSRGQAVEALRRRAA